MSPLEAKIKELARTYNLPEKLFEEAIALEVGKDTLNNRKLAPKIIELIEKYADFSR